MILIVGCGFLGSYLLKNINEYYKNEEILVTYNNVCPDISLEKVKCIRCDISKPEDLSMLSKMCKGEELTVFFFSASHNIDYVYENPDKAYEVNIGGLENFYRNIPNIKKLFFSSTDCVYGEGENIDKVFKEDAPLNPINEYGCQKARAEKIVLEKGNNVLRLPFMYGPSITTKSNFYDRVVSSLKSNQKSEMIDGMKRNALTYECASRLILALSRVDNIPRIINVCADCCKSKYEVGLEIARESSFDEGLIVKISEAEGAKFFKDKRAACINMSNHILKDILGIEKVG